jgi:hypothetical protein
MKNKRYKEEVKVVTEEDMTIQTKIKIRIKIITINKQHYQVY